MRRKRCVQHERGGVNEGGRICSRDGTTGEGRSISEKETQSEEW